MALTIASSPILARGLVAQPVVHRGSESHRYVVAEKPQQRYRVATGGALVLGAGFCRSQARKGKRCRLQASLKEPAEQAAAPDGEPDRLVRYLGGNVSVRAISATDLVQKVTGMHACSPMASIALGRLA